MFAKKEVTTLLARDPAPTRMFLQCMGLEEDGVFMLTLVLHARNVVCFLYCGLVVFKWYVEYNESC